MFIGSERLRRGAAAFILAAAAHAPSGAVADENASAWEGDANSAVRLIAGSSSAFTTLRAGIEIRLKPGWHTYWRYPGDTGVPPRFDFSGSRNVQAVTVLWPAPQRIVEQGLTAIGYTKHVILPLAVVPQRSNEPAMLSLAVDYAICERLCVPAQARMQVTLPERISAWDTVLAQAQARVPKKRAVGEGSSLVIRAVHHERREPRGRAVVDLAAPAVAELDLFVEGPTPDWALPVPIPLQPTPAGLRRFGFDLEGAPPQAKYERALLTITAVTSEEAIEVSTPLE